MKRWDDVVNDCLRKRGLDVRQARKMVHDKSEWSLPETSGKEIDSLRTGNNTAGGQIPKHPTQLDPLHPTPEKQADGKRND